MKVPLTNRAVRQAQALIRHYRDKGRPEAIDNLAAAVRDAQAGLPVARLRLPAPRPYPDIATHGALWARHGRYWFRYSLVPPSITAIYHDAADIPRRV